MASATHARTALSAAKRPKTFAAAAAPAKVVKPLRINATGGLAEVMRKIFAPQLVRSLRFCLRADKAFSGEDFASIPISTVRAAFTAAMQQLAGALGMGADDCIKDYLVHLTLCKSQVSCFYLMEAVCTPAFAEAAIAHLRPCGGILPMQLGRRSTAYAMRYEGENFAAAPFVLAITSAGGGEFSMAEEHAVELCSLSIQQFGIEPTWAVAVDRAGSVRSFLGLASAEEAARFPATRPRPAVSTCYVLVPGTRRAHDLVANLYATRNVAEVCLEATMLELHITRLLSRLPAAAPQAARRAASTDPPLAAPVGELPSIAEKEEEAEVEGDQQVAVTPEHQVAATAITEQQVAAAQQVAETFDNGDQQGAAEEDGQQNAAGGSDLQLAMADSSSSSSDEEITEADDGTAGGAATGAGFTEVRHGRKKRSSSRSDAQPAESAKLLKGRASKPQQTQPHRRRDITRLLGDGAPASTSSA